MQAEAHLHAVVGQPLQQAWMAAIDRDHPGLVDFGNNLDEGHHSHVSQLRLPLLGGTRQAPDEEEAIADVLVWGAVVVIHTPVHNLGDLVHEEHNFLLQDLGRIREVTDAAEAYDGANLLPGRHGLHTSAGATTHVLPDDLRAGLAKAQGQEAPEFDDGLLQHHRLHGLLHLLAKFVLVYELPTPAHLAELLLALRSLYLLAAMLQVA
mmetsp:Transcript_13064/g.27308  ORF Transcript_13064/g.27308 Transcript_13064/m.27308 type:complete len:208 (-) Transcript_13064:1954-2577(-)